MRTAVPLVVAAILPFVALAFWALLKPLFQGIPPPVFFSVAVAAAAWIGGFGSGFLATVISVGICDWFMFQPLGSFVVENRGDQIRLGAFACSSCLISLIGGAAKRAASRERDRAVLLQRREEELALALRGAGAGTWHWDLSTDSFTSSPELRRLMGANDDAAEITPAVFLARVHPDDRARIQQDFAAALPSATQIALEFRILRSPDQSVGWISAVGEVQADAAGRGRIARGIMVDITARKEAALALAAAKTALEHANIELEDRVRERTAELRESVERLESFSSAISHDLRAPLRAMRTFAELLQDDYGEKLDDTGRDYLQRIANAGARMDRLIVDVLQYTRISTQALPLERVDVAQLLQVILNHAPDLAAHRTDIDLDVRERELFVDGNSAALTQAFSNLLGNALKFVPPGQRAAVKVACYTRDGSVRVDVRDNGIGIAPKYQTQIWGMFERINSKDYAGTGVGLSIVKKVIERMSGSVGVDSDVGRGSLFWIELPRAASSAPTPTVPAPTAAQIAG